MEIEHLPSIVLLRYYEAAIKDIQAIENTITEYTGQLVQLEKNRGSSKNEEDIYTSRLLMYYIDLNEAAKNEILKFLVSQIHDYALFDSIERPYFVPLVYSGIPYSYRWMPSRFKITFLSDLSNKLLELEVKEHREIQEKYEKGDKSFFYDRAKKYITEKDIVARIEEMINSNHRLNSRKKVFDEAFKAYHTGSKYLFCTVIPLQIEGLFYDYCLELGIDEESIKSVSLSTKLQLIIKKNPQYSNFEYYTFRFPLIRNKVAHGQMIEEDIESFSDYLILDLYDVCNLLNSISLPVNKLLSIIKILSKNPRDMKALIRYCLYRNIPVPAFYKLEEVVITIREQIIQEPFWNYLHELIDAGSEMLKKGVLRIVTDLKKAEINVDWCKAILQKLNNVSTDGFAEEDFLDQLNYAG